MGIYRVDSRITPIGPRHHHVTVAAIAADLQSEDVRMDVAMTIAEAENRRDLLIAAVVAHLRARGHEVRER